MDQIITDNQLEFMIAKFLNENSIGRFIEDKENVLADARESYGECFVEIVKLFWDTLLDVKYTVTLKKQSQANGSA
ncbi:MAG: hypothetical protein CVU86_06415 [Firmicutes bacterium HGW-Firmicutes-11]|jgi:hypothetical protein|nr:MAG: hypothetical protein CVU86_06415 [Firmicutes bacterium HGW-Firmicutes-11]